MPEAELLEFLGSFGDKDSGWVDPFTLGDEEEEKDASPREEDGDDQ